MPNGFILSPRTIFVLSKVVVSRHAQNVGPHIVFSSHGRNFYRVGIYARPKFIYVYSNLF